MKGIYEFYWDCGRQGDVSGIFVADVIDVESAIGREIYFGEILGKHSEVYGVLNKSDLELKSDDQDFVSKFISIMGDGTVSGHNPLTNISE